MSGDVSVPSRSRAELSAFTALAQAAVKAKAAAGWCTCRCHGGANVPAVQKVEGRNVDTGGPSLCADCLQSVTAEETWTPFIEYVRGVAG